MYLPLKFMSPQAFYKPNCGAPFHPASRAARTLSAAHLSVECAACAQISLFSTPREIGQISPRVNGALPSSPAAIVFQELLFI
jgi:hypothetical protein